MAEIHHLIQTYGRDAAAQLLPARKDLVALASDILAQESDSFGITYSGFCLTALPHRRIPELIWRREGRRLMLLVQSGYRPNGSPVGIPYGSRARMILLYLQTRAVQSQSPDIELGRSMNDWLARMDIPVGGKTYTDIREQAARLSTCRLTFYWNDQNGKGGLSNDVIVQGAGIDFHRQDSDPRQNSFWVECVRLSDTFFHALREHPVPVWEPALRSISNKSMSIDIYIWLSYRLYSLSKPTPISWASLHEQFGAGFQTMRSFTQAFKKALEFALAVYPEARVELGERGLLLHPSRPPVEPRSLVVKQF